MRPFSTLLLYELHHFHSESRYIHSDATLCVKQAEGHQIPGEQR